jgi:hypothetical protein
MAVAVTVLGQHHLAGVGLVTFGTFAPTGTYATGGDASNLEAELRGYGTIHVVTCGFSLENRAEYDPATAKLRIFKLASGVPTELANGASYDADVAIPFVAYSR